MAKFKIWMVALTLIMGVSLSSCFDSGDDNPMRQISVIARLTTGTSYSNALVMQDGVELVPSDPTSLMLLNSGMYYVDIQYSIDDVQANSKSLKVTLLSTPTKIDGPDLTATVPTADAPMYDLTYRSNQEFYVPFMFDKYTLILPALYWVKPLTKENAEAELKKHSFIISYDEINEGDETLNLQVTHLITEDKDDLRTSYTVSLKAYDLSDVISEFESKGNTLKKIVLSAKTNDRTNSLDDSGDKTFDIDYTKVTE